MLRMTADEYEHEKHCNICIQAIKDGEPYQSTCCKASVKFYPLEPTHAGESAVCRDCCEYCGIEIKEAAFAIN